MSLRSKWAAGEETLGIWVSAPSFVNAEIAARQPVAYVCIDNQHGVNDYLSTAAMFQAVELAGNVPITRVPWNEPGIIGKMLDAGAHGVIVPMVNTREQAEAVVRAVRYAPDGSRSWGPMMASMRHPDYKSWAADNVAAIPMIETVEALDNLDEILSVPGVDAIYVGPADLSLSLGLEPKPNHDDPLFVGALERIVAACRRHGVVPGIHASGPLTPQRREQGFRMITVSGDAVALAAGFGADLAATAGSTPGAGPDKLY
jgi:4-hydroxy-2-oxoheptanedioate aldolase